MHKREGDLDAGRGGWGAGEGLPVTCTSWPELVKNPASQHPSSWLHGEAPCLQQLIDHGISQ